MSAIIDELAKEFEVEPQVLEAALARFFDAVSLEEPKLRPGARVIVHLGGEWAPGVVTRCHGSGIINTTVSRDGAPPEPMVSIPKGGDEPGPPKDFTWKFYEQCNHHGGSR